MTPYRSQNRSEIWAVLKLAFWQFFKQYTFVVLNLLSILRMTRVDYSPEEHIELIEVSENPFEH